ncbi:hypothetical protein DFH07DRAFT_973579 [Mycena maculata]|uniref:Uncharacterized protein n=1 Tax=Mycena maculata TaxID=230809 RepID=A0AAD7MHB7_9AGAR|nr:hypothetical protein DFH07DRAFT_973579 [Mycena maculata]
MLPKRHVPLYISVVDSTSGSESSPPTKAGLWNELKMLRRGRALGFGRGMDALLGEDGGEGEGDDAAGFEWEENDEDAEEEEVALAKYLTMTWWILVSLKTKLAPSDLHRLVHDVRRHEVNLERTELKVDHTTLLPQIPETTQHVLTQAGYASISQLPPSSSAKKDPFTLLDETREIVPSPDFACVCLDRVAEVLLSSAESAVFASSTKHRGPRRGGADTSHGPAPLPRALEPPRPAWPAERDILNVRQVAALSAVVFGRFEERFGMARLYC